MIRIVLATCALFALSCSSVLAQANAGWTIEYDQTDIAVSYSGGYASAGVDTQTGASCIVALWGVSNGYGYAYVSAYMLLFKGNNSTPTASFQASSRITGALQSSAASCTSTVDGKYFTKNTYTLNSQGQYDITLGGTTQTRSVQSAFSFSCDASIYGSGYGSATAQGKYNFVQ